jgi:hypothetical protein
MSVEGATGIPARVLRNEFAAVRVHIDNTGNGVVLMITDLKTGMSRRLDPLELESLIYLSGRQRTDLLDPATTRWSSDNGYDSAPPDEFIWNAAADHAAGTGAGIAP